MPQRLDAMARRLAEFIDGGNADARTHAVYGRVRRKLGEVEGGITASETATRIRGNDASLWRELGRAYRAGGRPADAEHAFLKAVEIDAQRPDGHVELGHVRMELGRLENALDAFRHARSLAPADGRICRSLGQTLHDLGRHTEAAEAYKRARAQLGDDPDLLYAMARLEGDRGNLEASIERAWRAVEQRPDFAVAWNYLAYAFQQRGRLADAAWAHRAALAARPDAAIVWNNLGFVLRKLGQPRAALKAVRQALTHEPNLARAWRNRGGILLDLGDTRKAKAAFERTLAIEPSHAEARINLANLLFTEHAYAEAERHYHVLLEAYPESRIVHGNLARLYERTNDMEAAARHLEAARDVVAQEPSVALAAASVYRRQGHLQDARRLLEVDAAEILQRTSSHRSEASFLLGGICDALGDAASAMANYRTANMLSRDLPYARQCQKDVFVEKVNRLTEVFTASWVATWRQPEMSPESASPPVFLVGFPRSGTTLVQTILQAHPKVETVEEQQTYGKVAERSQMEVGDWCQHLAGLDASQLKSLRDQYWQALGEHADVQSGSVVVDKHPLLSVDVGPIYRIFPEAKFVIMVRHPCDAVLSCFMQNFEANNAMVNFYDLQDAANLYDKVMRLLDTYMKVLPIDHVVIRYEDLIDDFAANVGRILDLVGLEWTSDVENYRHAPASRWNIRTPSYRQVFEPLSDRARYRWTRYRDEMADVLPTLLPWARYWGYPDLE